MAIFLDWIVRGNPVHSPQSSWVSAFGLCLVDDGRTGLAVEYHGNDKTRATVGVFYPFLGRATYDRLVRAAAG